ncbi:FAD-dependent monooxygenase [Kutzneria sp. CA-103260]|uniref:FAD-dependent monooxygenase n=1 Tax=Kutzneria sp. CA-103260 TaxID=2802641 RepID=UPI001BAC8E97|nr:FAD-dependent monooxygenase [Kutzneria sp. CA-103260]QUQ65276.1 monooxygenase [Kutzneria sp. CA-103260]
MALAHGRTAHIVGAGIAGLATAVALAGKGWSVQVFERSADLRATGGGIGITPNGMHALNEIGLGDMVRACSVIQRDGGVRAPSGRWIAHSPLGFVEKRYGEAIRALPRITLVRALASALPSGSVHCGARAEPVSTGDATRAAVMRVEGRELESALLVGADGIRSRTRQMMYPHHPGLRSGGAVSWRAMVSSDGLALTAAETWGAGLRFSILPLPDGMVHFSALAKISARRAVANGASELQALFGSWHDPIPELLERAWETSIFFDEIEEISRPVDNFTMGRIALAGDAAHPMTPNVGSASLALEDAVELAHVVADAAAWDALREGLACYDRVRRPRTSRLSRMSGRMGRFAQCSALPAVAARNGGVWLGGLLPEVVSRRPMDAMVGWSPPSTRATAAFGEATLRRAPPAV